MGSLLHFYIDNKICSVFREGAMPNVFEVINDLKKYSNCIGKENYEYKKHIEYCNEFYDKDVLNLINKNSYISLFEVKKLDNN